MCSSDLEEFTWDGIQQDIHQHVERFIAWMVMERMSHPPSYSLGVRENFQLSHFSSRPQVHNGGGIISCFVLYFFPLFEQHDVTRRDISFCILYDDVLVATCSTDFGYLFYELWRKPYVSWCAPMTPYCNFMFSSYEMTVAANKWLVKHLLFLILMQAKDALRWFHERDHDSLSGCYLETCSHCTLLPYIADMFMLMGSFIWRVQEVVEMPIGSMILPTLHVLHFRRNHGQTMIATSHFFSSCGRNHLENLRRHFMDELFVGKSYKLTIMILLHGLYEGKMRQHQKFFLLWLHLGEYG